MFRDDVVQAFLESAPDWMQGLYGRYDSDDLQDATQLGWGDGSPITDPYPPPAFSEEYAVPRNDEKWLSDSVAMNQLFDDGFDFSTGSTGSSGGASPTPPDLTQGGDPGLVNGGVGDYVTGPDGVPTDSLGNPLGGIDTGAGANIFNPGGTSGNGDTSGGIGGVTSGGE